MKRTLAILLLAAAAILPAAAQQSTSSGVSRRAGTDRTERTSRRAAKAPVKAAAVTGADDDASRLAWQKIVYRSLDLTKAGNAALYFPETPSAEGEENMFRIMMRLIADGTLPAYEYLDGHEAFDDAHRINVAEMLDRFHILYSTGKGHTERNPVYVVETADVPADEVLSYYIIESWEVDRNTTRMSTHVRAICPVLHRVGEFGQEAVRYPMFWMRYDDLRPYLLQRSIFTDDDNNLATSTYDDYFTLSLYDGEIYKTRNLRNKSMMQLYPDPDDLKHARDSIDRRLNTFEDGLWVPSLEELERRAQLAGYNAAEADSTAVGEEPARRTAKAGRVASARKAEKQAKKKKSSSRVSTGATRSVRNRKR